MTNLRQVLEEGAVRDDTPPLLPHHPPHRGLVGHGHGPRPLLHHGVLVPLLPVSLIRVAVSWEMLVEKIPRRMTHVQSVPRHSQLICRMVADGSPIVFGKPRQVSLPPYLFPLSQVLTRVVTGSILGMTVPGLIPVQGIVPSEGEAHDDRVL